MTVRELLEKANFMLTENNVEENFLKSRILLENIMEVSREYLIIHDDIIVSKKKEIEFLGKIKRLIKGEPIQYILNKAEFMGFEFYVDQNVLIPQPDTEVLVQNVILIANKIKKDNKIKILDLCTGSGAIGISLYKNLQNVEIFASDISSQALEIAKKNAIINDSKIEFIESDLFDNINEKFDIIVSNPPYIETATIDNLSLEVKHEPRIALDGGEDGLKFYRNITKEADDFLNTNGYLAVEIGYNQEEAVKDIFTKNGLKDIFTKNDFNKICRIVIGHY